MADERTRSRLGRFRRPVWRDPAFWAAVGITAVAFGIQIALVPDRSGWLVWLALGIRLVITWLVISALIRVRVGMERGLVAGFEDAQRRRGPSGTSSAETAARAGGRLAGRMLRAYRRGTERDSRR